MTLKEFAESFPDIYKKYNDHFYNQKVNLKPIDRLINFIESSYNISLINIVQEKNYNFRPCIRVNGIETTYNLFSAFWNWQDLFSKGRFCSED